jgi:hypothetical protein
VYPIGGAHDLSLQLVAVFYDAKYHRPSTTHSALGEPSIRTSTCGLLMRRTDSVVYRRSSTPFARSLGFVATQFLLLGEASQEFWCISTTFSDIPFTDASTFDPRPGRIILMSAKLVRCYPRPVHLELALIPFSSDIMQSSNRNDVHKLAQTARVRSYRGCRF